MGQEGKDGRRMRNLPILAGTVGRLPILLHHPLNRKCSTSPSFTSYVLPSTRNFPASFAPASPLPAI